MFGRARNLLRINKLYGLFRDYIENPSKRNKKHLAEMWDVLSDITEFKELISLEKMRMLKGNKTYILAGLAAAATAAKFLGFIDEGTWQTIMGFLGAGAVATTRAAISNNNEQIAQRINTLAAISSNPLAIPTKGTGLTGGHADANYGRGIGAKINK